MGARCNPLDLKIIPTKNEKGEFCWTKEQILDYLQYCSNENIRIQNIRAELEDLCYIAEQ